MLLGRLERLSTKYFLVHFSLNHCQKKMISFETLCSLISLLELTRRGYMYFSTPWSYAFFSVVWQNPYVPGSDHLSFSILLHKSFWCISLLIDFFYNFTGGHLTEGVFTPHHPKVMCIHKAPLQQKTGWIASLQVLSRALFTFLLFSPSRTPRKVFVCTPGKQYSSRGVVCYNSELVVPCQNQVKVKLKF